MPDINIFKLEGRPLEKLIQAINDGCGKLYEPIAIRRKSKAEAESMIILAEAKARAKAKFKETEISSLIEMEQRLLALQIDRQENINNIVNEAAEQLKGKEHVSDDPVSKDWNRRFFNIAQDISESEMQIIWGRLLAGEVTQPGSFSLRSLEILKNLTQKEALLFSKVASYRFEKGPHAIIPRHQRSEADYLKSNRLCSQADIINLDHCGLIDSANTLTTTFFGKTNSASKDFLRFGRIGLQLTRDERHQYKVFTLCWPLTTSGAEIAKLIPFAEDKKFVEYTKQLLEKQQVKVHYALIQQFNEDGQTYNINLIDDFEESSINA